MKLFSLFSLLFLLQFGTTINAQLYHEIESGTYTPLSDATIWLENVDFDDDATLVPSIGFPFLFRGEEYIGVNISADGFSFFNEGGNLGFMFVLSNDLVDRDSQSVISHKLEGDPGSRKFKIEWKNIGIKCGTSGDFANFQLWLLEDDCYKMEMHYGESSIASTSYCDGAAGPSVGFVFAGDFTATAMGNPLNPTWTSSQNATLSIPPPDGTVYRFRECEVSPAIDLTKKAGIKIYPNPVKDNFTIELKNIPLNGKEASVFIYDISGRGILKKNSILVSNGIFELSLTETPSGLFILKLIVAGKIFTAKVFKE